MTLTRLLYIIQKESSFKPLVYATAVLLILFVIGLIITQGQLRIGEIVVAVTCAALTYLAFYFGFPFPVSPLTMLTLIVICGAISAILVK